jgi:hypothetical protein
MRIRKKDRKKLSDDDERGLRQLEEQDPAAAEQWRAVFLKFHVEAIAQDVRWENRHGNILARPDDDRPRELNWAAERGLSSSPISGPTLECECPEKDPNRWAVCPICHLEKASLLGNPIPGKERIPHWNPLPYALTIRALGDEYKFSVHFLSKKDCDAACQAVTNLKTPVLGHKNRFQAYRDWLLANWTAFGRPPRQPGPCRLKLLSSAEVRRKLPALALDERTIRRRLQPFRLHLSALVDTFSKGHILPEDRRQAQDYRVGVTLQLWKERLRQV